LAVTDVIFPTRVRILTGSIFAMPPASRAGNKRSIDAVDSQDDFTSVYGSRFAIQDLPSEDIPEESMPPEIAYRMIKDELSLDNNPMLKYVNRFLATIGGAELTRIYSLASFVSTYMVNLRNLPIVPRGRKTRERNHHFHQQKLICVPHRRKRQRSL
jgi:hypothetical protein